MNVRFSEGEIRFRVSHAELTQLLEGGTLGLSGHPLSFRIDSVSGASEPTHLKSTSSELRLTLSLDALRQLQNRLPSRDGIEQEIELEMGRRVHVAFEVDLKS